MALRSLSMVSRLVLAWASCVHAGRIANHLRAIVVDDVHTMKEAPPLNGTANASWTGNVTLADMDTEVERYRYFSINVLGTDSAGAYFEFNWVTAFGSSSTLKILARQCRDGVSIWEGDVVLHHGVPGVKMGDSIGYRYPDGKRDEWRQGDILVDTKTTCDPVSSTTTTTIMEVSSSEAERRRQQRQNEFEYFYHGLKDGSLEVTWETVYEADGSVKLGEKDFNRVFQQAGIGIIKRVCPGCALAYKSIIIRVEDPSTWNAYQELLVTWTASGFKDELNLYSSLYDALDNRSRWDFCNGNDKHVGFPRDCYPNVSQARGHQWNSLTKAGQRQYNFLVCRITPVPTTTTTTTTTRFVLMASELSGIGLGETADTIFSAADTSGDKTIVWTEYKKFVDGNASSADQIKTLFKKACTSTVNDEAYKKLYVMFEHWDRDSSGTVSAQELKTVTSVLNRLEGSSIATKIMTQADTNRDKAMDMAELNGWLNCVDFAKLSLVANKMRKVK